MKFWTCELCHKQVNEIGAYVKHATTRYTHLSCYFDLSKNLARQELLREQEEARQERARIEDKPVRIPPPEDKPVRIPPPEDKPVLNRQEWDELADKVIEKQIINFGPMVPRTPLKQFLWRLWHAFKDAGMIVQVIDPQEEFKEVKKVTLDEYLKGVK